MTQLAIDRGLTLIAWEAMNHWTERRQLQRPRLPQEQRARRLLLGPARAAAARLDGRLRPAAARRGDQLRRHRPRRRHRPVGARDQRRDGADPAQRLRRRLAVRLGADAHFERDPRTRAARSRSSRRARAAGRGPGRARHRRQLHPPGHRRAADVRDGRGPGPLPARHAVRRRLLRRGHGLRVGAPDLVRRADVHGRGRACTTTPSTTARRSCGTRRRGRTARRCSSTCRS